jgi:hypothetical protein
MLSATQLLLFPSSLWKEKTQKAVYWRVTTALAQLAHDDLEPAAIALATFQLSGIQGRGLAGETAPETSVRSPNLLETTVIEG